MDVFTDDEEKPIGFGARPGALRFCTLQDCMSVMSSWRENAAGNSDNDTDSSFTDEEYHTFFVIPNTNMSNSGKQGKATEGNPSETAVSGSDSNYFNPVSATASENTIASGVVAKRGSSDDSVGDDGPKRSSILTRIKKSLKKNPKFVNANSKLLEVTPARLQFQQNEDGVYQPVEMVMRNVFDSTLAYKLKRSDNIFEVTRRMGVLKPLEVHSITVSIKPSGKMSPGSNYKLIARVAALQDNEVSEGYQLAKFWKQLPAREVRQLAKVKCCLLAPGQALLDTADFSDADTVSLMTTGSGFVSGASSRFTLAGADSAQVSPAPSGHQSELSVKDSLQNTSSANEAEMTVTRSLEQIKSEIFGVTESSEMPERMSKPKDKQPGRAKVFEKKQTEQGKKTKQPGDTRREPDEKPHDKGTSDGSVQNKAKMFGSTKSPVSDGGDFIPDKSNTEDKMPQLTYENPTEAYPNSTDQKTIMERDSGIEETPFHTKPPKNPKRETEVKEKHHSAGQEQSKGVVQNNEIDSSQTSQAAPNEPSYQRSDAQGVMNHGHKANRERVSPVSPRAMDRTYLPDQAPSERMTRHTPTEEPQEGSRFKDPKMVQEMDVPSTEFERPSPEIPALVDAQAYKKSQSPRRPVAKDGSKHDSDPTLSMPETYGDLHKLKQSLSHSESPIADYGYPESQQMKHPDNPHGYSLPRHEPFQTDESELEYDSGFVNKPSIHIYRSAWSHSPTIPNQKFIKREVSSRDLTREHCMETGHECFPKITRNAPFYDFVMSHGQQPSPLSWQSPKSSGMMLCPGHQYKLNSTSPITIEERSSHSSLENSHSMEFQDIDPSSITVTAHISTSSLQEAANAAAAASMHASPAPTSCTPLPQSLCSSPRHPPSRKLRSKPTASDYFECSADDADAEDVVGVVDTMQWKMRKIQHNRKKIANLAQNVLSGMIFLVVWATLLLASLINSYGSGLCWEAPPEPEPLGYEWITSYFFDQANSLFSS